MAILRRRGMLGRSRDKMQDPPARMCPDCACTTVMHQGRRSIDCWFCERQLERPAARASSTPMTRVLAKFK